MQQRSSSAVRAGGRLRLAVALALTLALGASFLQNFHTGLADNGDFTRLMQWIVSRPANVLVNWPKGGTSDYDLRFYQSWIPLWHVDFHPENLSSTAAILWLPGVLLSVLVHPGKISLAVVGSCAEVLIGLLYFGFLMTGCTEMALTIIFGLLFSLMLSTCDYAAYYASFYAEAASGSFFLLFLLALAAVIRRPDKVRIVFYLVSATLLGACKLQNSYLWLVSLALLFWLLFKAEVLNLPAAAFTILVAIAVGAVPIATLWRQSSAQDLFHYNDYNRMYHGILEFADDPRVLLPLIGADDQSCVGTIVFTETGARCAKSYPASYSRASALRLLLREPMIVLRMVAFAAGSMQDISLEYLGKYQLGDARAVPLPRGGPSSWISAERRDFYTQIPQPAWNLWSSIKYHGFPRGRALFVYLVVAAALFGSMLGSRDRLALRYVGLFCLFTCASQMAVAILGDGKEEIIKHLYLANVAFDASLILLVGAVLILLREVVRITRHRRMPRTMPG